MSFEEDFPSFIDEEETETAEDIPEEDGLSEEGVPKEGDYDEDIPEENEIEEMEDGLT